MRRLMLAAALLAAAALPCPAQRPGERQPPAEGRSAIPPGVAREAAEVYNATPTLRSVGPLTVDSARTVEGDVAVIDGPLVVAGRVTGRVVAINADVELRPGAVVEGDVLVLGGRLAGRDGATLGGDVRIHAERLEYREADDRILVDEDDRGPTPAEEWWARWRERRDRSGARLSVATGKTYNRVEGLPIMAGPAFRGRYEWGEVDAEALGILRTADDARWDPDNLGHQARAELRVGGDRGLLFGGELYDVVRAVEEWQLPADEVGLASAFLHRDFRDYYGAHGGALFAGVYAGPDADVRLRFADERWRSRAERDPFSLFRNGDPWRPNPRADEGAFHVAGATLRVDTRNVEDRPWSGWYVVADYERGQGRTTLPPVPTFAPVPTPLTRAVTYGRGFLDVRRYNRIAPGRQVNLRVVLGGWLHGDPLPAQRRFSVGGPGTLPGYDFRSVVGAADLNQCSGTVVEFGTPAQCDRVALVQAEYRGDLHFSLGFDGWGELRSHRGRRSEWVAFANSGRGWLLGTPPAGVAGEAGELWVRRGSLPSLGTFRTDVGLGIDLGVFGVYVAKAISEPGQRANFYVRLHERF
jgi:hypothetical protein